MKFTLHLLALFINNTQIVKKHTGIFIQDLKNKSCPLSRGKVPHPSFHERSQDRSILGTDGKNRVLRNDNAKGDGSIPFFVVSFLNHRNVHQYQRIVVLHFDTGTFLLIQRCPQVIHIDLVAL